MQASTSVRFKPATASVVGAHARVSVIASRPRIVRGAAARTSKLSVSACINERIGNTEFWRAQQVKCVRHRLALRHGADACMRAVWG